MSMVMLYREELEEKCPTVMRMYPNIQDLIVPREILPRDFEVHTPTLNGISPKQREITKQAIDEYLEPEMEIIYEMEADYEDIPEKKPTKINLCKNRSEQFMGFCAAAAAIFILIGGLFQIIISSQIPSEKKAPVMLVLPEGIPQEEPAPAGEKKVENMPHKNYPQRELNLGGIQGLNIKNDWRRSDESIETELEQDGVTSESFTREHETRMILEHTTEFSCPGNKSEVA